MNKQGVNKSQKKGVAAVNATTDIDQWLKERNISKDWAERAAMAISTEYPALAAAVKAHRDVRAELELMVLIDKVSRESRRATQIGL